MRVLVAPDSFGGTLSAAEAAAAIEAGWRVGAPHDTVLARPLSDGGPGFVEVLHRALGGDLVPVAVVDPLGRPAQGTVLVADGVAYVESAQACGLRLLDPPERDPKVTSSYGVGLLLAAAVETGARTVVVGLGGSATNDGGAGALAALGAGPVGADHTGLPHGGATLYACAGLAGTPRLRGADLVVATDVDNPLLGPHGASAVYGPQKGASRNDVQLLDLALTRWAEVLERELDTAPPGLARLPGAGAAGGLGAALLALGARRQPGAELVRRLTGFDAAVIDAVDPIDLVVTGEGSFDAQSLRGKVVAGVAAAATGAGLPCLVLAGQVSVGRREAAAAGVAAAYSLAGHLGSVEAALAGAHQGLGALAARIARQWSPPPRPG